MENTIKIGGVERAYSVTYGYFKEVMKSYKRYYNNATDKFYKVTGIKYDIKNEDHRIIIPHEFFFESVWGALVKSGRWPLRKPFKSIKRMALVVSMEEYNEILSFCGTVLLKSDDDDSKKSDSDKLSLVEYFNIIEEAYLYQRHRLRTFCNYTEDEIDALDIEQGKQELEWLHDQEMKDKIDMFSVHGIDVRDIKKMGTSFYRDYIMKKQRGHTKPDDPEDIEKFKGGFDNILKSKRGAKVGRRKRKIR